MLLGLSFTSYVGPRTEGPWNHPRSGKWHRMDGSLSPWRSGWSLEARLGQSLPFSGVCGYLILIVLRLVCLLEEDTELSSIEFLVNKWCILTQRRKSSGVFGLKKYSVRSQGQLMVVGPWPVSFWMQSLTLNPGDNSALLWKAMFWPCWQQSCGSFMFVFSPFLAQGLLHVNCWKGWSHAHKHTCAHMHTRAHLWTLCLPYLHFSLFCTLRPQ